MRTTSLPDLILASAVDQVGSSEGRGVVGDPPISAPDLQAGQFEIRPGVWAYEDGVPLEILLPHLEHRRAPIPR